jgi:hypothetical protein
MRLVSKLLVVMMCWAAAAPFAAATDVDFPSANAVVARFGVTTYLDLARHFVTDIAPTDNGYVGKARIPVRHIAGKDFDNDATGSFGFFDISTVPVDVGGKQRLAVLFDFAQAAEQPQGVAILALYDISGEPKLLDAADIGFDESTYFFDQAVMPVAEGTDVLLTLSTHYNSSQTYTTYSMIMVRDDRLELIDTAFLFSEKQCGWERQQTIRYSANPGAAKPYAPISVIANETVTPITAECADEVAPPAASRDIKVVYAWDGASGRYVRDSEALDRLASANRERF